MNAELSEAEYTTFRSVIRRALASHNLSEYELIFVQKYDRLFQQWGRRVHVSEHSREAFNLLDEKTGNAQG